MKSLIGQKDISCSMKSFFSSRVWAYLDASAFSFSFLFFHIKVRMYEKYSERNNWRYSAVSSSEVCLTDIFRGISCCCWHDWHRFLALFQAEKGGFKTYVMEIKGKRVYSKLKYESGVHRVQRVPQTETQGRVHTSTATVAIMPEVAYIYLSL